jgi:hypothetical protein
MIKQFDIKNRKMSWNTNSINPTPEIPFMSGGKTSFGESFSCGCNRIVHSHQNALEHQHQHAIQKLEKIQNKLPPVTFVDMFINE